MLERTSAIATGLAAGSRLRSGVAGVQIGEVRGWSLLQIAGFGGGRTPLDLVVGAACAVTVPGRIGEAVRSSDLVVMRTGPEQLWIVAPDRLAALEPALRADVAPAIGVVTNLSHSRTRMFIEGPRARDVLAKEIAVDLDPAVFGLNRFALTGFDHTPVLLHRASAGRYEIYAMRTFALNVWDRLADMALEFGYEVART